jgi:hypothetical protein
MDDAAARTAAMEEAPPAAGCNTRSHRAARPSHVRSRKAGAWLALALVAGLGGDRVQAAPAEPMSARLSHRRVVPYPFDVVWPTAIRYLRVDRGYSIVDRDPEAGYLLFEFPVGRDSKGSGSLEAFRTTDDAGRPSVNLQVGTDAGPSHLPTTIVDGISQKVKAERGQPAPPPPKAPPEPKPEPDDREPPTLFEPEL